MFELHVLFVGGDGWLVDGGGEMVAAAAAADSIEKEGVLTAMEGMFYERMISISPESWITRVELRGIPVPSELTSCSFLEYCKTWA